MTVRAPVVVEGAVRRGPDHWRRSFGAMIRFDLARHRQALVTLLLVQLLMGVGSALMYGYYLGRVDPTTALYLATGVPTLALIPIGFVVVPLIVMEDEIAGTREFTWSLPVPRMVAVASAFTLFVVASLPGVAATTAVAGLRYGVALSPSWWVVPAAVLVSLMGTSVGYGMASLIPEPRLTNLITNVLVFFLLLFSPIVIPIDRFPAWLADVHRVLPFWYAAESIRAGLAHGMVADPGRSLLVLGVWTLGGWLAVAWAVGRRG